MEVFKMKKTHVDEWLEIYMENDEYDELYYNEDDPTLELYRDDDEEDLII